MDNNLGKILAVGFETGDIVVIDLLEYSMLFRLPDYRQKGGKVTGVEFLTSQLGLFVSIFRETPSSFSVIQIGEENQITEIARLDYQKNASLLQMTLYENSMLFITTLSGTVLDISVYDQRDSVTELIILDKKEFTSEELLTDLNITIPEQSIFYNKIECGCDI